VERERAVMWVEDGCREAEGGRCVWVEREKAG
jgi:hypothetical protein